MSKTKFNTNINTNKEEISALINNNLKELLLIAKSNNIQINEKLIKKAFLINYEVNKNRILKSGLPSYTLHLEISKLICNYIKLDDISIIAVFLTDISYYNPEYDYNFIKNEFGLVVAEIVDGINQFRKIESNSIESKGLDTKQNKYENINEIKLEQQKYIDNYRKLLLSLFKDVRIILIKLVERLVLMRDLIYFSPEEREIISNETLQLYVPYASRFGLSQIKSELEDLTFKFLNPKEYELLEKKLSGTYKDREIYINEFITPIKEKLSKNEFLINNKISFEISGRAKHIYSIYNKIIIRSIPLEQLNDIVAMRIVLDSEDENLCFYFYGLIANLYPPVPETFKDYISKPKTNGYKSLHVALLGPQNKPVEVQIRTSVMHLESEKGISAHFNYKSGFVTAQSILNNKYVLDWMENVRELLEDNNENSEELIETLKESMFLEEIHIFSPKNQLFSFNKGATVLDFAFAVHSDLGYKCLGAKVNNNIVEIKYKMKSGDQVEIISSNKYQINENSLNYVFTSRSKSFILKYLKNIEKSKIKDGQKNLEMELKKRKINISNDNLKNVILNYGYENENKFYKDYFTGLIDKNMFISSIIYGSSDIHYTNFKQNKLLLNNDNNTLLNKNTNYSIVIEGKYRNSIINDVLDTLIEIEGLNLISVNSNTNDLEFSANFTINLDKDVNFNSIKNLLNLTNGIQKISLK